MIPLLDQSAPVIPGNAHAHRRYGSGGLPRRHWLGANPQHQALRFNLRSGLERVGPSAVWITTLDGQRSVRGYRGCRGHQDDSEGSPMTQLFTSIILVHLVVNLVFLAVSSQEDVAASCGLDVTLFCGTPFADLYTEFYGESADFKFWDIFRIEFLKSMTTSVFGLFFFNYEILKVGGIIVGIFRGLLIMLGIGAMIGSCSSSAR